VAAQAAMTQQLLAALQCQNGADAAATQKLQSVTVMLVPLKTSNATAPLKGLQLAKSTPPTNEEAVACRDKTSTSEVVA